MKQRHDIKVFFSQSCLDEIKRSNIGECIPCSINFMGTILPVIFINLSEDDMQYFGIKMKPFTFNWRLRYLHDSENELIEIQLKFQRGRILNIDLDPSFSNVRQFLRLLKERKKIAYYFYNSEKNEIDGSFFLIEHEELDWIKRNYRRANALNNNNFYLIQNGRIGTSKSNEKFYTGKNISNNKLFLNQDSKLVIMEKVCRYLGNKNQA